MVKWLIFSWLQKISLTQETLDYIHQHKTGKLIATSVEVGAVLAKSDKSVVDGLASYAQKIGFAFQIIDDIFDGDNYVELLGADQAREVANTLILEAKQELEQIPLKQNNPHGIGDFVASRKH